MTVAKIKVILVEDQVLVREALCALLSLQEKIEVVGQAPSGQAGLALVGVKQPDVVLLDVQMADGNGLWATGEILRTYPNVRCLLLTTFAKDEYLSDAIAIGASGYLLKDTPIEQVVEAIETVMAGGTWIAPSMSNRLRDIMRQDKLNEREKRVLQLADSGMTNREIAQVLYLAEGSVKNLWTELLRKLEAKNRVEALATARKRGII